MNKISQNNVLISNFVSDSQENLLAPIAAKPKTNSRALLVEKDETELTFDIDDIFDESVNGIDLTRTVLNNPPKKPDCRRKTFTEADFELQEIMLYQQEENEEGSTSFDISCSNFLSNNIQQENSGSSIPIPNQNFTAPLPSNWKFSPPLRTRNGMQFDSDFAQENNISLLRVSGEFFGSKANPVFVKTR